MAMLLLSLSGCAIKIKDSTFCSPIPGGYGAVCDNFITHKPETLSESEWQARIISWEAKGWALECTTSDAVGNLKSELEQLCSRTTCDNDTSDAVRMVVGVLSKMENTAKKAKAIQ